MRSAAAGIDGREVGAALAAQVRGLGTRAPIAGARQRAVGERQVDDLRQREGGTRAQERSRNVGDGLGCRSCGRFQDDDAAGARWRGRVCERARATQRQRHEECRKRGARQAAPLELSPHRLPFTKAAGARVHRPRRAHPPAARCRAAFAQRRAPSYPSYYGCGFSCRQGVARLLDQHTPPPPAMLRPTTAERRFTVRRQATAPRSW